MTSNRGDAKQSRKRLDSYSVKLETVTNRINGPDIDLRTTKGRNVVVRKYHHIFTSTDQEMYSSNISR